MTMVRFSALATLAVVVALLTACNEPEPGTAAACAAPTITASATSADPGATLQLSGTGFLTGCRDTSEVDNGTLAPQENLSPLTDLVVRWEQGDALQELATVDADAQGEWSTTVTIPAQAVPGDATLRVDPAGTLTITVE